MKRFVIVVGVVALSIGACSSAASFVAEKAAVGTWDCATSKGDWEHPARVSVAVDSDRTFTLLDDSRPNNRLRPGTSGRWKVVDGVLKVSVEGATGRFEGFGDLDEGQHELAGFLGIDADVTVDVQGTDRFTIRRTPTKDQPRQDERAWTCEKR